MCGVCCVFTNCLGCTATKQHPQEAEKYNTYTIVSFPQSQKPEKDTPCWISKIIRFYPRLSSVFFFTKFSLSSSDEKFYLFILFSFADVNIESPPSMHPCKRICDITGFEVCGTMEEDFFSLNSFHYHSCHQSSHSDAMLIHYKFYLNKIKQKETSILSQELRLNLAKL